MIDERYAEQVMADMVTLGEGVIGQVAQRGRGEMVNRVDLDPRALTIPGTPNEPESLLAVPLAVGERVIGLITRGIGQPDTAPVVNDRCTWLEVAEDLR